MRACFHKREARPHSDAQSDSAGEMAKYLLSEDYGQGEDVSLPMTIWPTSQFERQYGVLDRLGQGKFGEVRRVAHKKTGAVWAAKFTHCSRASEKLRAREEIDALRAVAGHPNVVRMAAAYEDEDTFIQGEFICSCLRDVT